MLGPPECARAARVCAGADVTTELLRLVLSYEKFTRDTCAETQHSGYAIRTGSRDLTFEFAHVMEEQITELASTCWSSPTVAADKHSIGHDTYNSRLLAKCLLASISPELSLTFLNWIPTLYHNEGTYTLWALTNNIYQNNITYVESVREKIVTATVSQHDNDVEKYLICVLHALLASQMQYS